MIEKPKKQFFYGYVIVLISFLIMVMTGTVFYTFPVFFTPLLTEMGWTRAMTSGAYSLNTLFGAVFALAAGRLTDRLGPKLVVTACGLLLGLGYSLLSRTNTIWQFYLFYGVIMAMGQRSASIPMQSTVARWFVKKRGMMTGVIMSAMGICAIVIVPLASRLIDSYGWRNSYLILGGLALLVVTLAAQFLKRDPGEIGQLPYGVNEKPIEGQGVSEQGLTFREVIRTRKYWLFSIMHFCFIFVVNTVLVHIIAQATELGMTSTSAANIIAIIGASGIVGRITLGTIGDKITFRSANVIGLMLLTATMFWLVAAKDVWMLYLFGIFYGLAQGGEAALSAPLQAEFFGLRSLGVILGSTSVTGMIGGALGPVLAGYIFDVTGKYQLAFLLLAIASLIGFVLALFLKPAGKETLVKAVVG